MKIINYETVSKFLEENKSILLERESVSQLILFNALINEKESTSPTKCFGKVVDDKNGPLLLFANVHPYNLLIHAVCPRGYTSGVIELADYIIDRGIEINGLNTKKEICDCFIEEYKRKQLGYDFKENLAMDIMELRSLKEIKLAEGKFRNAKLDDLDIIAKWMVEFASDALGESVFYDDQIPKAKHMIESRAFYVFENTEGILVSMAAAARQLPNGVCINYVYTPEQYRNKGYAATNMYYLSKSILDQGNQFCTLFVDKKNPISNRVYKKIGYEIIEDQFDYRLYRRDKI